MFRRALLPLLAASMALGLATAPAIAQRGDSPFTQWDRPREERAPQRDLVPLAVVVAKLEAKYGGRLRGATPAGNYYNIDWQTADGRMLKLRVNAITGREE